VLMWMELFRLIRSLPSQPPYNSRVMGDLESRIEQVNRYYRWRRGCRRGTRV